MRSVKLQWTSKAFWSASQLCFAPCETNVRKYPSSGQGHKEGIRSV
jgi:hypothetical protein